MKINLPLLLALLAPLAAGCGSDDPVSYSAPVVIAFDNIKPGTSNAILESKSITQPNGNPWGKFLSDAKLRLGHDPSRIVVTGATIELLTSTGFAGLQDVFAGPVSVSFEVTPSSYQLASVANPTGVGPIPMVLAFGTFDSTTMAGDYASLLGSTFSVVLAGTAPTATSGANVQTTFTFVAYP